MPHLSQKYSYFKHNIINVEKYFIKQKKHFQLNGTRKENFQSVFFRKM